MLCIYIWCSSMLHKRWSLILRFAKHCARLSFELHVGIFKQRGLQRSVILIVYHQSAGGSECGSRYWGAALVHIVHIMAYQRAFKTLKMQSLDFPLAPQDRTITSVNTRKLGWATGEKCFRPFDRFGLWIAMEWFESTIRTLVFWLTKIRSSILFGGDTIQEVNGEEAKALRVLALLSCPVLLVFNCFLRLVGWRDGCGCCQGCQESGAFSDLVYERSAPCHVVQRPCLTSSFFLTMSLPTTSQGQDLIFKVQRLSESPWVSLDRRGNIRRSCNSLQWNSNKTTTSFLTCLLFSSLASTHSLNHGVWRTICMNCSLMLSILSVGFARALTDVYASCWHSFWSLRSSAKFGLEYKYPMPSERIDQATCKRLE